MKRGKSSFLKKMRRVNLKSSIQDTTNTSTADDERVFLVDETLAFRFSTIDGDATCGWKDLSGDDGDLWEFVSSKVRQCHEDLLSQGRPCRRLRIAYLKSRCSIVCSKGWVS